MSEEPSPDRLVRRGEPIDLRPLEIPHASPFLCDLTVGRHHRTTVDHVSNIEYLRWLDGAAERHADHLGYSRQSLLEAGIMWFVARHEIDYLAEVWPGDELVVATWVRDMRRVKSWRDYVVFRPADGQVVCRAATLWVLVGLATRRPVRIPTEMAARFEPLRLPKAGQGGSLTPAAPLRWPENSAKTVDLSISDPSMQEGQ